MSGQPLKKPSDENKFRNQYMEVLQLQAKIDDMNLQANKTYKDTGSLPPQAQMPDTRTTSEKLMDIERLKQYIVDELRPIAEPAFALSVINRVISSPLNIDGSLVRFMAQNIKQIVVLLQKKYGIGIKGDSQDIENFVSNIENLWTNTKETMQSIKSVFESTKPSESTRGILSENNVDTIILEIQNIIKRLAIRRSRAIGTTLQRLDNLAYNFKFIKDIIIRNGAITVYIDRLNPEAWINGIDMARQEDAIFQLQFLHDVITTLPKFDQIKALIDTLYTYESVRNVSNYDEQVYNLKLNDVIDRIYKLIDPFVVQRPRIEEVVNELEAINNPPPNPPPQEAIPGVGQFFIPHDVGEEEEEEDESYEQYPQRQTPPTLETRMAERLRRQREQEEDPDYMHDVYQQYNEGYYIPPPNQGIDLKSMIENLTRKKYKDMTDEDFHSGYALISVYYEMKGNNTPPPDDKKTIYKELKKIDKELKMNRNPISVPSSSVQETAQQNTPNENSTIRGFLTALDEATNPTIEIPGSSEKLRLKRVIIRFMEDLSDAEIEDFHDLLMSLHYNGYGSRRDISRQEKINNLSLLLADLYQSGDWVPGKFGISQGFGITRPIKKRVGRPKGSGVGKHLHYTAFGQSEINKDRLKDGILTIRRGSKGKYLDVPSRHVSTKFQNVINSIIGGGVPSFNDMSSLDEEEKIYLNKIIKKAGLEDKLSIPAPSKDQQEKDIHNFEVLKGQILSGNDSQELVKRFKLLIRKLSRQGLLPKAEVNDLLDTLLDLGY